MAFRGSIALAALLAACAHEWDELRGDAPAAGTGGEGGDSGIVADSGGFPGQDSGPAGDGAAPDVASDVDGAGGSDTGTSDAGDGSTTPPSQWALGSYGGCSATSCGQGSRTASYYCKDWQGKQVNDLDCKSPKPSPETESCVGQYYYKLDCYVQGDPEWACSSGEAHWKWWCYKDGVFQTGGKVVCENAGCTTAGMTAGCSATSCTSSVGMIGPQK